MWRRVDYVAKACVVVPLLLVGIALTQVSEWLIRAGAWLADVDESESN